MDASAIDAVVAEQSARLAVIEAAYRNVTLYSSGANSTPVDRGHSLVVRCRAEEADSFFVRWTDASNRQGRRLSIDEFGRVKTIVAFAVPVEDFRGDRIVVVAAPMVMIVTTASGRPSVPDWLLLVRQHEELKLFPGPFRQPLHTTKCIVCDVMKRTLDADAMNERYLSLSDEYGCIKCSCFWHVECACDFNPAATEYTDYFAYLCPLCA